MSKARCSLTTKPEIFEPYHRILSAPKAVFFSAIAFLTNIRWYNKKIDIATIPINNNAGEQHPDMTNDTRRYDKLIQTILQTITIRQTTTADIATISNSNI